MDHFKTSQLFCIANYLTGFFIVRVLTERCFQTDYNKFANIPKSVSKPVIFFSLCIVMSITSCPEHSLLIYYLTLPIVDSPCPRHMGHTLCNCIFLGIVALLHSTYSSASSFLI